MVPVLLWPVLLWPVLLWPVLLWPVLLWPVLLWPVLLWLLLLWLLLWGPVAARAGMDRKNVVPHEPVLPSLSPDDRSHDFQHCLAGNGWGNFFPMGTAVDRIGFLLPGDEAQTGDGGTIGGSRSVFVMMTTERNPGMATSILPLPERQCGPAAARVGLEPTGRCSDLT